MNPLLNQPQPHPFARLREAMRGQTAPADPQPVHLQVGKSKHITPKITTGALVTSLAELSKYPLTADLPGLRQACANWAARHYQGVELSPDTEVLPVLDSHEALFSFAQVLLDPVSDGLRPVVVSPSPFYQIYEGAALLGGGEIRFANCPALSFEPDWRSIGENFRQRTQLAFVCSPNNPSDSMLQLNDWKELFDLQDKYGFTIASDECYSEIYFDGEKPIGDLEAAHKLGRDNKGPVIFINLSKRSSVPGLRSGFVAGDAEILSRLLLYRTYHGSAMDIPMQHASIATWDDEQHVVENHRLYQKKFDRMLPILQQAFSVGRPGTSFYIQLKMPDGDDLAFAKKLWQDATIQVLPGRSPACDAEYGSPGEGYVRIALVADVDTYIKAAETIVAFYQK